MLTCLVLWLMTPVIEAKSLLLPFRPTLMHNAIRNLESLVLTDKSPVNVINRLPEDLIVHIAMYAGVADVFALRQASSYASYVITGRFSYSRSDPMHRLAVDYTR